MEPETKWQEFYRSLFAIVCIAGILCGWLVWGVSRLVIAIGKCLRIAGSEVRAAFAELGRDFKLILKGEG